MNERRLYHFDQITSDHWARHQQLCYSALRCTTDYEHLFTHVALSRHLSVETRLAWKHSTTGCLSVSKRCCCRCEQFECHTCTGARSALTPVYC